MGFKANRSAAGDQAAAQSLRLTERAEATAKQDKIAEISELLTEQTRLRRRRFGSRPFLGGPSGGGDFGIPSGASGGQAAANNNFFGLLLRGIGGLA